MLFAAEPLLRSPLPAAHRAAAGHWLLARRSLARRSLAHQSRARWSRARRLAALAILVAVALVHPLTHRPAHAAGAGICPAAGGDPGAPALPGLSMGGLIGEGVGGSSVDEFVATVSGTLPRPAPLLCDAVPAAHRVAGTAEPASLPAAAPAHSAGNPVDVVTGNKYARQIDVALPHLQSSALSPDGIAAAFGLPADDSLNLLFARHYNSRSDFALTLGRGWSHSFDTRLARLSRNGRIELQIVQADGRRLVFHRLARRGRGGARTFGTGSVADGLVEENEASTDSPFVWRWPGGRRIVFDAQGRLASIRSADLDVIRLRRDDAGRLVEASDNAGRALVFEYREERIVALRLPDGQRIAYDYDRYGQLVAVRYPDGRSQRYHYEDPSAFHLLTGIADTDGRRSHYRYDEARRVAYSRAIGQREDEALYFAYRLPARAGLAGVTEVRAGKRLTRFEWVRPPGAREPVLVASSGDPCSRCPPVGLRIRTSREGRLVRIGAMRLHYDAPGRLVARSLVDERGRVRWTERRAYGDDDPLSPPVRIERPSVVGQRKVVVVLAYNERAQLASARVAGFAPEGSKARPIAAGLRFEYVPDSRPAAGRLRAIAREAPEGLHRTSFLYDDRRRLVRIDQGTSMHHRIERDALGRAIRERLPDGHTCTRRFDAAWRLERTAARGSSVRFEYDAAGRPRAVDWSDGQRWTLTLDAHGIQIESNRGWRRRFVATPAPATPAPAPHRLLALAMARSEPGRRQLVDAALHRSEWLYDDLGRLVQASSDREGTRRLRYDAYGRLASIERADGSVDRREYDLDGRLRLRVQTKGDESVRTRFIHDGAQLVVVSSPAQGSMATRDDEGRLVELMHRRNGVVYTERFEYDARGRLSRQTLSDGSQLHYEYDDTGRPERLSIRLGDAEPWRTIAQRVAPHAGETLALQLGNGLRYSQSDDALGRPVSLSWSMPSPSTAPGNRDITHEPAPLAFRRIAWSAAGLPLAIEHEAGEDRYAYDRLGRLIVRERHGTASDDTVQHREYFAVDALGERLGAARRDGSAWRAPELARDAAGHATRFGTLALRYGAQQRIVEARTPTTNATYRYDAFGQRIARTTATADGTRETTGFLYRGQQLVAETDAAGRLVRRYLRWNGRLVAILGAAPTHSITWIHTDHLGTPIAATDESARVVWRGDYDAYGRLAAAQGDLRQPLRLPGQYSDAESALHDNLLRSYDPDAGAYLEPDPLGLAAGLNPYAYVDGNPLAGTDPLGLILFAFDGTGNGATGLDGEDVTNVRKFFEAYESPDKWYMAGVGRDDEASGIDAAPFEVADARSAHERVDFMVTTLDRFLDDRWVGKIAPIDVVGFSRGAAMARDFVNQVSVLIDDDHFRYRGICVDLRFLGLWDTVAQFGLLGLANPTWKLAIPTAVRATFHAVALNEHRSFYPLESVSGSSAWVIERGFIGSHADVGGGNAESDLSDISLVWMTRMAQALDVPVHDPTPRQSWVSDPLVHDRNYFGVGDRKVYQRDATGHVVRETAQRETAIARMSWADTLRFLIPYPRRGIDALGEPSLVARVDMEAYAQWLASTYGIEIRH